MDLDGCRVRAFAAYRTVDLDFAFVDRDLTLFFECIGNVFARYRAEQLAAFTDLDGDRDRDFFELCTEKHRFFCLDLCFACFRAFFQLNVVEVGRRCFYCCFFRDEYVSCVCFRYFDHVIFFA